MGSLTAVHLRTRRRGPRRPLPVFFLLSHLAGDGPVRIDGVKVGVCELMGLEIDAPKLGAFAGALNALGLSAPAARAPAPARPRGPEGEAPASLSPTTFRSRPGGPPSHCRCC